MRRLTTLLLFLNVVACSADGRAPDAVSPPAGSSASSRPPIVEVFACGDYCPGPREQYLVKAYQGVKDRETCLRLGGRPYEYVGWGKHFVCLAENQPPPVPRPPARAP